MIAEDEMWWKALTAVLICSSPFIPVAGFLLAFNEGHVRPRWAAGLIGLLLAVTVGLLGALAARKAD